MPLCGAAISMTACLLHTQQSMTMTRMSALLTQQMVVNNPAAAQMPGVLMLWMVLQSVGKDRHLTAV